MAEISSDKSRFRSAYVSLWELLNSTISERSWFWYGEVGLYGNGGVEAWRPLLLRRIRQPDGAVKIQKRDFTSLVEFTMPDFYGEFLEATKQKGVLSVLRAVHAQFGRQQSDRAPLPVFAALNSKEETPSDELRNRLVERAKKMEELAGNRYHVFLSSEISEAKETKSARNTESGSNWVDQYAEYVKTVMNISFYKTSEDEGALYPPHAWLFAVPIYTIQHGRPLLLAIFIIIAEGIDFAWDDEEAIRLRQDRLQEIESDLVKLEVQATHILSHRFFNEIDGYVPGSDPIVLLAHPSLSKEGFIKELRMEDDNHKPREFLKKFNTEDSALKRAFERSYVNAKKVCLERSITHGNRSLYGMREGEVDPCRWLKPLYAHRRERAHLPYEPSANGTYTYDDGSFKALGWLLALLRPVSVASETSFTNRVFLYPPDKEDAVHKRFHWPVEPGVRFLIPWLNAVRSIGAATESNGITIMLISGSSSPWADNNLEKQPCLELGERSELKSKLIDKWILLRSKDEVRPNGILAVFDCSASDRGGEGLESQIQGWTRALWNPFGRRGHDTAPIQNMLLGDIGAVLSSEGLTFPGSDPLFLPLTGSLPIDVDLKVLDAELLLAVTWKVNS